MSRASLYWASLLVLGCSGESALAPPPRPSPAPPPSASAVAVAPSASVNPAEAAPEPEKRGPLNVLLILIDSMRADMPWAGYKRQIAPNLSALEKESVSYTRGYAVSSYTAKSVAALLSGQYPSTLKRSGYFFTRYPKDNLFFPELLQAAGVHTMAVHGHMYMARDNGMEQGFDVWKVVDGLTFNPNTDTAITSQKMTPQAIEYLEAAPKDKPKFMYIHYMDPHDKYVRHAEAPDFGKSDRDRYDQEIFYTDLWIGKLLDWAKQQDWWKNTAVIVSADHGEGFGEHHRYRHAFELWEMLVHVPLFIHLPGAKPRRIDTPRGAIDLAPTILDLMQVEKSEKFAGKSLIEELYGAKPEPRPVILDLPADSNNPERHAMIDGDYKLLAFGNNWRFDLYNLKTDPGEKNDLAKAEPEKFAQMKARYLEIWNQLELVKPFGGNKLQGGGTANGPE